MIRVGDLGILCPVCHKPDWCLIDPSGKFAICARIPNGRPIGEAGWLHQIRGKPIKVKEIKRSRPNNINWNYLCNMYRNQLTPRLIYGLRNRWSVGWGVLDKMMVGWTSEAWSFPVRGADLQIVGIQRIFPDNSKQMVNGSRVGILVPDGTDWGSHLFITEGVSDTCVALDLGLNVVGRLSCTCGTDIIVNIVRRFKTPKVIIISDNDTVGVEGSKKLKNKLINQNKYLSNANLCVIIYSEAGKDLRDLRDLQGKKKLQDYFKVISYEKGV